MKTVLIIILLICSYTIQSQEELPQQKKWILSLTYNPELNLSRAFIKQSESLNYKLQQKTFNYTTGINAYYRIRKRIDIGFGLLYSTKDYGLTEYCNTCGVDNPKTQLIQQRYMEVPAYIRYNLILKKIDLFFESGFENAFLISENNNFNTITSSKKYLLIEQISLGCNFNLSKSMKFSLTTTYRESLKSLVKEVDYKIFSLGISTALVYKL